MKTRNISFLAALCCTVLSGVVGVSQSVEVGESAELARAGGRDNNRALNLGLATTEIMDVEGNIALIRVSEPAQGRDLTGDGDLDDEQVLHVFDAASGDVRNLGLQSRGNPLLQGRVLAFCADERPVDLNGDGDLFDSVLHVYDTVRRSLTNTRLAGCSFVTDGRRLAFDVQEVFGGRDLNGDGDTQDGVLHIFDLVTGRIHNTKLVMTNVVGRTSVLFLDDRRLAVAADRPFGSNNVGVHLVDTVTGRVSDLGLSIGVLAFQRGFEVGGGEALAVVQEVDQRVDLNGDGDQSDLVLHSIELASGRVRNTGITIALPTPILSFEAQGGSFPFVLQEGLAVFSIAEADQGKDLNGDGDLDDPVLHVLSTRTGRLRNLKVVATIRVSDSLPGRAALFMSELANGKDLNGDGDLGLDLDGDGMIGGGVFGEFESEIVLGLADLRGEPRIVNTGRVVFPSGTNLDDLGALFGDNDAFQLRDNLVTFVVPEVLQANRDLNGDGDTTDAVLHVADLLTLTTRNTGLSGAFAYRAVQAPPLPASDGRAVVSVSESRQGRDLNRDGDTEDMVLQFLDVRSARSRNTGLAIAAPIPDEIFTPYKIPLMIRGETFVSVLLPEDRVDLNSDGDKADHVLHILDVETGRLTNVGLASGTDTPVGVGFSNQVFNFVGLCPGPGFLSPFDGPACVGPGIGDAYTFLVSEAAQGNVDLNGDGDTDDTVVHATRLTDRDRNGRFDFAENASRAGE